MAEGSGGRAGRAGSAERDRKLEKENCSCTTVGSELMFGGGCVKVVTG